MGDSVLRVFPASPDYVPDEATAQAAQREASRLFPGASGIEVEVYPAVALIDCGENLELVACPDCHAELGVEWWQEQMDRLYDGALWDAPGLDVETAFEVPCCRRTTTLPTLDYDWPMGFARFCVDVRNPSPWPADVELVAATLTEALGVPMRGIWAHY